MEGREGAGSSGTGNDRASELWEKGGRRGREGGREEEEGSILLLPSA